MSYIDIVICIGPDRILETWPPIYRGQERMVRDRLRVSQVHHRIYSRCTPCLTDLYLRVHPTPYSPDPKSFILDIYRVNPRHRGSLVNHAPDCFLAPCQSQLATTFRSNFFCPTGRLNFGFILRENLLLCSSYLPLRVSQLVLWDITSPSHLQDHHHHPKHQHHLHLKIRRHPPHSLW
jgi:hypothetical protein